MSTASLVSRLRNRRSDVDAARLGFVVALLLFPLRFLASQIYIETIPIVLGVASGLYMLSVRGTRRRTATPALPALVSRALPSLAFVGLTAMVLTAWFANGRTLPFYALSGLVGTLVLAQLLFVGADEFRPRLLVGQVLALAVVLRLAALYTTPGFVGIDIWTHVPTLARSIYAAESLDAISTNKHYAAPFYHLLIISTAHLLDVTLREGLILSLGVAVPLSILLIYATTRLLVPVRWAIFAMALYAVADYFVEWGIHIIPTSHGLIFFFGVCYALLRLMRTEYNVRDFVLLVLFTVAVILTHQVSSFIMLVVIGAGLLAQLVLRLDLFRSSPLDPDVFRTMSPVNLVGLLVFDVGFITFMWSLTPYNGDSFLETILSYLAQTLVESAGFLNLAGEESAAAAAAGAAAKPSTIEIVATYVDKGGFLLLLCLAIVGCLYVLRRRCASHSVFTLLFATTAMLVFVLGLPLFGIRNFIPQRWFAFLYVPMVVLAAIAVRYLSAHLDRRVFVACLVVFALCYPSVMVMSSNGTVDSPAFPNHQERLSYTDAELHAASTIGDITGSPDSSNLRPDQVIRTDHPYQTLFSRSGAYPAEAATVADGEPASGHIKVYRSYQSTGASYFVSGNGSPKIRDVPRSRVCRPGDNTLYANGQVVMCTTP